MDDTDVVRPVIKTLSAYAIQVIAPAQLLRQQRTSVRDDVRAMIPHPNWIGPP